MEQIQYLPGFDSASPKNRRMVTSDCPADMPDVFRVTHIMDRHLRSAAQSLSRKRNTAEVLETVEWPGLQAVTLEDDDPWRGLVDSTQETVVEHLDQVDLRPMKRVLKAPVEAIREHMLYASYSGIATVGAFLEVVPRILASEQERELPVAELARTALRSKGFIINWIGLHDAVEYRLAYALAAPKPRIQSELFTGLRFHPKWFALQAGRVVLDASKAVNLRAPDNQRHPSGIQPAGSVLYGCPARRMIPALYGAMVQAADENGLFERTYSEARRGLGYD